MPTNRLIWLAWAALALLVGIRWYAAKDSGDVEMAPTVASDEVAPVLDEAVRVPLSSLKQVKSSGIWNGPGNIVFTMDVLIDLPEAIDIRSLDLSLDHNDTYRVEILTADGYIPIGDLLPIEGSGLARRQLSVPDLPLSMKATQVRVSALKGDGMYSIGHLVINP
ncbi:MAG: hypothetical protein RL245_1069 [Pseudomonadota bacterium]